MHKDLSTPSYFSKAAPIYHEQARAQLEIAKELSEKLPQAGVGRVLELGCGTGFLTSLLATRYPRAHIDAVDASRGMIARARQLVSAPAVRWHLCDAREYFDPEPYDLITSSSALQWMQPLSDLFGRLKPLLKQSGRLSFALMISGTLQELRRIRAIVAPGKPLTGKLPEEQPILDDLSRQGFCILDAKRSLYQTQYRSAVDFLRVIKELGFTGGTLSAAAAPLSRSQIQSVLREYQKTHSLLDGRVTATFVSLRVEAKLA